MPATLKERLDKIEHGQKEVLRLFMEVMKDSSDMYVSDFLLMGVLKRTIAHAEGFRGHIEKRNFICAGTILRAQLDTALRGNAISLVEKPEQFASDVVGGARINKMKDGKGRQLTDAYLADRLSESYPWIKEVYENLAAIGHFSHRHIFASVSKTNDANRTVHFQISAEDPERPEEDYFEVVECFYETMRITCVNTASLHAALRKSHGQNAPKASGEVK